MARPRTPATILEMRGAFKRNPKRRRFRVPRGAPLDTEPDATWSPALQREWLERVDDAPDRLYEKADRTALRITAQLHCIQNEAVPGSRLWLKVETALWKHRNHLGLTPLARKRLHL